MILQNAAMTIPIPGDLTDIDDGINLMVDHMLA